MQLKNRENDLTESGKGLGGLEPEQGLELGLAQGQASNSSQKGVFDGVMKETSGVVNGNGAGLIKETPPSGITALPTALSTAVGVAGVPSSLSFSTTSSSSSSSNERKL